jgi:hypothetical protein
MFNVIVAVMRQNILEAENRMPAGEEVRNEKRHSLEELHGGAGCERRFVNRMPQQPVDELFRGLAQAPESWVGEPPSTRRQERPPDLLG